MTLVVHVAGLADLGINAKGSEANTHRDECLVRLSHLHKDPGLSLNQGSLQELHDLTVSKTPLGTLLERFSHSDEDFHLFTIGTTQGDGATFPIATALDKSIHLLQAHYPEFQRLTFHPFSVPTLAPKDVGTAQTTLEDLCQKHSRCFLLLGGGATSIVVTLAGLLDQLTGGNWDFLPLKEEVHSIPELVSRQAMHADALNAWLMALGLPTEVDTSNITNDELRAAAICANKAFDVALNPQQNATYTPDLIAQSMALVTYCYVARGDLAAGLSIRAWIEREYKRQHLLDPMAFDAFSSGGMLGTAIESLKKRSELEDCNSWLLTQEKFKNAGISATHDLDAPSQDSPSATRLDDAASRKDTFELTLEALSPTMPCPAWLSWPEPKACVIYVQGSAQDTRERSSIPKQLLNTKQTDKLQRAIGCPGQATNLSILCVSTQESRSQAQWVRDDLEKSKTSDPTWSPRPKDFIIIDAPTKASAEELSTLYDKIKNHIQDAKPRVLLVAATGKKELALTCLLAAQDAGATAGIPVFLFSTRSDCDGVPVLDEHQYGLSIQHRPALLQVARRCVERFDFYTAGRILSMGDATLVSHSDTAFLLADYLQKARKHRTKPSSSPLILNVLKAVVDLFDSASLTIDAQLRLITIVGELISLNNVSEKDHPLHAKVSPTYSGDISTMEPWALLGFLVEVRDRIPLNHGEDTLTKVMSDVAQFSTQKKKQRTSPLRTRAGQTPTYGELLRQALHAASSRAKDLNIDVSADDWYTHFNELRKLL